MLDAAEVRAVFSLVMGRDDVATAVVERHRKFASIAELRLHLMRSGAFLRKVAMHSAGALEAPLDPARTVTVFQHIPKAGGSSLHNALKDALGQPVFAERRNGLGNWPAGMLAQAQFLSGHFDTASLALIPAARLRVVTMLRDPAARLISLYRFLRSIHPRAGAQQQRNMNLIKLARALEPAAFFAHPDLIHHPSINNAQTRQLAGALGLKSWESHPAPHAQPLDAEALARAAAHLESMAGFALLEDQARTLPALFGALGLAAPQMLEHTNNTDTNDGVLFEPVAAVPVTDEIQESLASHIEIDAQLYYAAKQILDRRRSAG